MSCERMIGIMTISQNDPRNDHKGVTMYEIKITVNGKEIELSGFPGEIISEAVVAHAQDPARGGGGQGCGD